MNIHKFIKKILDFQNKLIPKIDKLQHFYMGFFYAIITAFFTDSLLIIGVPFFFALTKELRDFKGYGKVELLDVVFTILPSILIYFIK